MKKKVLLVICLVTLLAVPLYGQAFNSANLKGNIPFEFMIGNATLPAGQYIIHKSNSAEHLMISTTDGRNFSFVQTVGIQRPAGRPEALLVFNRYGNKYFLKQIWNSWRRSGLEVLTMDAEKQYARTLGPVEVAYVSVRNQ